MNISGGGMDPAETVGEEDREDIAESLAGKGEGFARLVRRYQDRVASQMWRFTRDTVVLDQLVQDVFVEAYLGLKGFRGRAPFLHWLRRIATRVGIRYWKAQARIKEREEAFMETNPNLTVAPETLSPREAADMLYQLFGKLPPADRLILTLFYFEECDVKEISARSGWNRTLVKVRLHRARKKLKLLLEEAGMGGDQDG